MPIFSHPDYKGHEGVFFHHEPRSGLRCIIAVHSTARGPATGGCRMWAYDSDDLALKDVLRLSRGMSYKNAVSDLALGGGKAVIIGDPHSDKSPELFRAFGRFVNTLGGIYITAEDVGIDTADMELVAEETRFVAGLEKTGITPSGDPSPFTAFGVHLGVRRMAEIRLQRESLQGVAVAVQGLGHVGFRLAEMLARDGAQLTVTDMEEDACAKAKDRFGATVVGLEEIYDQEAEVFAPCALGGTINEKTVPRLKAKVIAGAANNQLSTPEIGRLLQERSIAYAPDYVINCGGIINVEGEIYGCYSPEASREKIRQTIHRLGEIVLQSEAQGVPSNIIADRYAEQMLHTRPHAPEIAPGAPADRRIRTAVGAD